MFFASLITADTNAHLVKLPYYSSAGRSSNVNVLFCFVSYCVGRLQRQTWSAIFIALLRFVLISLHQRPSVLQTSLCKWFLENPLKAFILLHSQYWVCFQDTINLTFAWMLTVDYGDNVSNIISAQDHYVSVNALLHTHARTHTYTHTPEVLWRKQLLRVRSV